MRSSFKVSMVAFALAGMAFVGASAKAGSLQLSNNGVDSGWKVVWSDSYGQINPIGVDSVSANAVFIEKMAIFNDGPKNGFIDPFVLAFQQTSASAVPFIVINDEQVVNQTGMDWGGFRMFLLGNASFDPALSAVNVAGGFDTTPFADSQFVNSNTELASSNGVVANGAVWFPGTAFPGSGLWINANPASTYNNAFSLKEQPLPIPLPAGAWTGLSALVGLGVLGSVKKSLKSLVA